MHLESFYFFGFEFRVIPFFRVVEICSRTSIPVKEMLVCPLGKEMALHFRIIAPRGHSITSHTWGLAQRPESKTPKYQSKNRNILKILKSYHLNILKVQSESSRLSIWDKLSFSLRIVPLIIHKNHFIYPLTIVHINIFENIFSQPKSQTPNNQASPPHIECPPGLLHSI